MKIASALVSAAALTFQVATSQTLIYSFDGHCSAGIEGQIIVDYVEPGSTKAKIFADLDFSGVDIDTIGALDGNCTADIVEYKWHIHVKWSSHKTSQSLGQCSKVLTGNHYDPLKACGPFSEFADTGECRAKVKDYKCTPETYAADPEACEKGDLSGKFGSFKPTESGLLAGGWVDEFYPAFEENTPEWNMIIHAVCGKATPRIACALGQQLVFQDEDSYDSKKARRHHWF